MKVYCGKCKWLWFSGIGDAIDPPSHYKCNFPSNIKEVTRNGWRKKNHYRGWKVSPQKRNANNDCSDYQVKWYRRWF
jgi:hypothetical protein